MRIAALAAILTCLSGSVNAQAIEVLPLLDENVFSIGPIEPQVSRAHVTIAELGVTLRAIDKISGEVVDFALEPQQTKQLGRIQVTLGQCRYPTQNPAGDAFAHLTIRNAGDAVAVFSGWMIASSPALSALDHARYDVWPLRCNIEAGS